MTVQSQGSAAEPLELEVPGNAACFPEGHVTPTELRAYIDGEKPPEQAGTRAAAYIRHWDRVLRGDGWYAGFNFYAAFFGVLWAFYRRMYLPGIVVQISIVVSSGAVGALSGSGPVAGLFAVTVWGFVANRLYLWRTLREVNRSRERHGSSETEEHLAELRRRGGASVGYVVGILVVLFVVVFSVVLLVQ